MLSVTGFDAARWTELLEQEAEATRSTASALLAGRPAATARVVAGAAAASSA